MNFVRKVLPSLMQKLPFYSRTTRNISTTNILQFRPTLCLFAEPLKRKKRLDPAIVRAREERKKRKLEKQIRRLEKSSKQLKPILECEIPPNLIDKKALYQRPPTPETAVDMDNFIALMKQWAKFKRDEHLADVQLLDKIAFSQQKALDELRLESEELYNEAIQVDFSLLPYKSEGPTNTPPIKNYDSPDGEYLDVSKKW